MNTETKIKEISSKRKWETPELFSLDVHNTMYGGGEIWDKETSSGSFS